MPTIREHSNIREEIFAAEGTCTTKSAKSFNTNEEVAQH